MRGFVSWVAPFRSDRCGYTMPLYWPVKPITNPFGPQALARMAPHVPFRHNDGRAHLGSHVHHDGQCTTVAMLTTAATCATAATRPSAAAACATHATATACATSTHTRGHPQTRNPPRPRMNAHVTARVRCIMPWSSNRTQERGTHEQQGQEGQGPLRWHARQR